MQAVLAAAHETRASPCKSASSASARSTSSAFRRRISALFHLSARSDVQRSASSGAELQSARASALLVVLSEHDDRDAQREGRGRLHVEVGGGRRKGRLVAGRAPLARGAERRATTPVHDAFEPDMRETRPDGTTMHRRGAAGHE